LVVFGLFTSIRNRRYLKGGKVGATCGKLVCIYIEFWRLFCFYFSHLDEKNTNVAFGALWCVACCYHLLLLFLLPHRCGDVELQRCNVCINIYSAHTDALYARLRGLDGVFFFFIIIQTLNIVKTSNIQKKEEEDEEEEETWGMCLCY